VTDLAENQLTLSDGCFDMHKLAYAAWQHPSLDRRDRDFLEKLYGDYSDQLGDPFGHLL